MAGRDDDFEALMASMGVNKLDDKRPKQKPRAPAGPPPRRTQPSHRPVQRPVPPEDPQLTLARLNRELSDALSKLEAASAERDALARSLQAEASALAGAEQRLEATQATLGEAEAERDRLDQERRALQRQLSEAQEPEPTPEHTPAKAVFMGRGLSPDEAAAALAGLVHARPRELVDALLLADPRPLAQLLEQRVVLTADPELATEGSVAVRVSAERCELGSGSDLAGAWRRFARACGEASVAHVCIVGGSPNYRRQLKELAGNELQLNLVPGTIHRKRHRVESDVRAADLVVIWGSTELDHAVAEPYTAAGGDKVVSINHRGLSRMLDLVRERVDGWARL